MKSGATSGWFWPGVAVLLGLLGTIQVLSIRKETQNWDEGLELAAGYSYLKTGDFRMEVGHPPLGKLLVAFPLLFLNPIIPVEHPSWEHSHDPPFGVEFL